jgi:hypothetical protein
MDNLMLMVDGSNDPLPPDPDPEVTVDSIDPNSVEAGCQDDLVIVVLGTNFTQELAATFGGGAVDTLFVSSTELRLTVPAALLQTAGHKQVRVGRSWKQFSITERGSG